MYNCSRQQLTADILEFQETYKSFKIYPYGELIWKVSFI